MRRVNAPNVNFDFLKCNIFLVTSAIQDHSRCSSSATTMPIFNRLIVNIVIFEPCKKNPTMRRNLYQNTRNYQNAKKAEMQGSKPPILK